MGSAGGDADVIVVGGGIAGLGAAVAKDRGLSRWFSKPRRWRLQRPRSR